MKNKFLKISAPIIVAGSVTSMITPILVENKNNNYENETSKPRIVETDSNYNKISLKFDVKMFSPNSIASVPGGFFIPTSSGAKLINNNFEEVWTCDKTMIGSGESNQIYDATYVPETSAPGSSDGSILVTSKDMNNVTVSLIDLKTGKVFSENKIDLSNFNNYHPDVVNNSDLFMLTKVQEATGQYIFTSKSKLMENSERNKSTFLIKLNNNSIESIENVSLFEENGVFDTILFSMVAVNINGQIYALTLQNYVENDLSRVFVILTKMNETQEEIDYKEIKMLKGNKNNEDESFVPNKFVIPTIKVDKTNNGFTFSVLANLSETRNLLIAGGFNDNKVDVGREISLTYGFNNDNINQNYDIKSGYFSNQLNKWITYSVIKDTKTSSKFGSIVIFSDENIYRNKDFGIYNKYNVHAITNINNGPLLSNVNDIWIPFTSYDNESLDKKNINVIKFSKPQESNNEVFSYNYVYSLKKSQALLEIILGSFLCLGGGISLFLPIYILLKKKKN